MNEYRRGYYSAAVGRIWARKMKRPFIKDEDARALYNFVAGILNTDNSGVINKVIAKLDISSVEECSVEALITTADSDKPNNPDNDQEKIRTDVANESDDESE